MTQQEANSNQTEKRPSFNLEVLNSEIREIKKRRFVNKQKEIVSRDNFDYLELEYFIEDKEYRSNAFNTVIDELYSEENNAAWDEWHNTLDPEKESADPIRKGFVGLAFSGGGIRSATFNLGVLQGLNSFGLFKCVDYLSTVSGGGYIGSCVSALYASLDKETQANASSNNDDLNAESKGTCKNSIEEGNEDSKAESREDNCINKNISELTVFPFEHTQGERESAIFRHLRNHASYLAPEGFIDALRIPATLFRGIIVNFLVLLPYLLLAAILTVWLMPTESHIAGTEMLNVFGLFEFSSRFILSKCLITLFLSVMALSPLFFMFRRTGSPEIKLSAWKLRERIGKIIGGFIVMTGMVAFIELQPTAIQFIHDIETESFTSADLSLFSGAIGVILAIFGNHLLPKISKYSGTFAVYFIGVIGFLTMWLVYLALCSAAVNWGVATHELVIDNADRIINDYERLQLIIMAFIGTLISYQWLKVRVAFINTLSSVILLWICIIGSLAAFGYHHFISEIPIAKLSTVDLEDEYLALLSNYSLVGLVLWLYGLTCVDVNFTSIHRFYRDKLSKAYIIGVKENGSKSAEKVGNQVIHTEGVQLSSLNSYRSPYHLINTLLNLDKTAEKHQNGRHGDFFLFSKNYIGGESTGYCQTKSMEAVSRHVDLATAMAISGAAAAPNAGKVTVKPLMFIMGLLNIRLNYWLLNPEKVNGPHVQLYRSALTRVGPTYFFRELLGRPDAKHDYVNLSDGGHIENLGVYELLRRQCRLIVAGDGEADKQLTFQGLSELVRMVQIDMGIKIELQGLDEIRHGKQHYAIGTIHYGGGRIGKLIYLKSSLLGDNNLKATLGKEQYTTSPHRDDNLMYDDNAYIAHYKENNPDFPHQTTADQFFDEAQFECYRALGYQVALRTFFKF